MNKVLERLMVDLSVRPTNMHVGSGLGGNPSEFLFMLTHNFAVAHPSTNDISFKEKNGVILILCPSNVPMQSLRKELSAFYEKHTDKREVTFDQISNLSFLRDIANPSLNIRLLIKCIGMTTQLSNSLKDKEEINSTIGKFFNNEYDKLKKDLEEYLLYQLPDREPSFYKKHWDEDSLTESQMIEYDNFADPSIHERDIFHQMINSLPTFKSRKDDLEKKTEMALAAIYSSEDDKLINEIISFPKAISIFCIRTLIGIDRIIKFNLDLKLKSLDANEDDNG